MFSFAGPYTASNLRSLPTDHPKHYRGLNRKFNINLQMVALYIPSLDMLGMAKISFLFFVQETQINDVLFLRCFDNEGCDYLIPESALSKIRHRKDAYPYRVHKLLLNYLV